MRSTVNTIVHNECQKMTDKNKDFKWTLKQQFSLEVFLLPPLKISRKLSPVAFFLLCKSFQRTFSAFFLWLLLLLRWGTKKNTKMLSLLSKCLFIYRWIYFGVIKRIKEKNAREMQLNNVNCLDKKKEKKKALISGPFDGAIVENNRTILSSHVGGQERYQIVGTSTWQTVKRITHGLKGKSNKFYEKLATP